MRHGRVVILTMLFAAALSAVPPSLADNVDVAVGDLTVSASWRAQPTLIAPGSSTRFKLTLTATGSDATSGIAFAPALFHFVSGSDSSQPVTQDLALSASAPSAGNTLTAMLPSLSVTYFEEGIYTATMSTSDASISWQQGGAPKSGTFSLNLGTTVGVGASLPVIEAASVPVLIQQGKGFSFSALADSASSSLVSYEWDFNYDGSFAADSTLRNPNYAYASAGQHTGMLRVTDANGSTPFEFQVDVLASVINPVPLPTAVWCGLGLLAVVGAKRLHESRKQEAA